jgi:hypothetical protein
MEAIGRNPDGPIRNEEPDMTYEVQLEALKADADMWDETSSTLLDASTNAWSLNLHEYELSWAAEVVGLTDTYSAIQ